MYPLTETKGSRCVSATESPVSSMFKFTDFCVFVLWKCLFFLIAWSIYHRKKSYSKKNNSFYLRIICFRSRNSKRCLTFSNVTSISTAVRCIVMTHINYPDLSKMQKRRTEERTVELFCGKLLLPHTPSHQSRLRK